MEVFVDSPIRHHNHGGLKRQRPEFISRCDSRSPVIGHDNDAPDRKRKRNAVSDVLARQQVLSALVRAQNTDKKGENPADRAFYEHVTACSKGVTCREHNCSLGKKSLEHFERCRKQDCILCVEARLIQTIDRAGMKNDEERFLMSAWRARLQSVNDETREFVPYFNTCAQELAVAKATNSPFLQSAKDRFVAAHALVSQSEKRYADLCSEIYRRWIATEEKDTTSDHSSDLGMYEILHDSPACGKSPSPMSPLPLPVDEDPEDSSVSSWRCLEEDKKLRLQIVERVFEWSKVHNKSDLSDDALLEGAKKAEAILYSKARSRQEYEDETAMMCRLCEA